MSDTFLTDAALVPLPPILPVSSLVRLARETVERAFPLCWVTGEVSNLVQAASGHVYFSLKDNEAQVRCVMYRQRAQLLGWRVENGQHIDARARVTIYEPRGDFQLLVDTARKTGQGNLFEQFLKLKDKLEREGLFAPERKRELPKFPRCLGVVTSLQAAALQDVLSALSRRAPYLKIILYPAPVQGADAPRELAAAISRADARKECDVLIVCRGGGSIEDLWAFNDEALARAIFACTIPVISGVGHESDVTIADFVADRRAPTPTAAAELAAPERSALRRLLDEGRQGLFRPMRRRIDRHSQTLDGLARRCISPAQQIVRQRERLAELSRRFFATTILACERKKNTLAVFVHRLGLARPNLGDSRRRLDTLSLTLDGALKRGMSDRRACLDRLAPSLVHLDPKKVLARGYSIVFNNEGKILRSSQRLSPQDALFVSFHEGNARATVTSVTHEAANGLLK